MKGECGHGKRHGQGVQGSRQPIAAEETEARIPESAGVELAPFLAAVGLFILSYVGLAISFYPYIVPPSVTIWAAAAPDNSLQFLLVGAVVLLPLILAYTAYSYWVFRGKVDPAGGYH